MDKSRVSLSYAKLKKRMYDRIAKEQTKRLIAYAQKEIDNIAGTIPLSERTGNLLDSLCWAVYFKGQLKKSGYYRNKTSSKDSYLHEFTTSIRESIDGHSLAQRFISVYKPTISDGWEIVWGILAPYYAYWEKGHKNILFGRFVKFAVMAERHDQIKEVLRGARTRVIVNVPRY